MQKIREIVLFENIAKFLSIIESLQVARTKLFVVVPLTLVQTLKIPHVVTLVIAHTEAIDIFAIDVVDNLLL